MVTMAHVIASRFLDRMPGGVGDKKKPSDFDPAAVAKGKKVEMEHTDDPNRATEIAVDHLSEDPKYYDKLEVMEKGASDERVTIEVTVSAGQSVKTLKELLLALKHMGDIGSTREINIPNDGREKFYSGEWDGDGSDRIYEIRIDGEPIK